VTTTGDALDAAVALGVARVDARMLVLHSAGRATHDRAWLLANNLTALPDEAMSRFMSAVQRRLAGEPVAYITGHKEFYGLPLQIDARVLDPRDDTETLVDWALEMLGDGHLEGKAIGGVDAAPANVRVVDLGTGSGAIALALQHARPGWEVHAVDLSHGALEVARANAARLQLGVHFWQGSWLEPLTGLFDAVISNPPYIAEDDAHLPALRHEPAQALVSGADGLDDIRRIVNNARPRLKPGGWVLLEHGFDQAGPVRRLLSDAGMTSVQSRTDLAGIERCSGGRLPD